MKIIGISGRKQAGKNTVANYINGEVLRHREMVTDFYIDENGKLIVQTVDVNGESGYGELDVTRKDKVFLEYAHKELWPYIKVYHFADPLKDMAINLFGLNPNHVYGSDNDKNTPTDLEWKNIPLSTKKSGNPTVREFLEHFGTKIVRKIKNDAWSKYSINKITSEGSELAIIPDVRFPNEVEAIKSEGGIVIRLTRNTFNSDAEAETALDNNVFDYKKFDIVIDNGDMSIEELCSTLKSHSMIWSI
jgi:hypothetical protein